MARGDGGSQSDVDILVRFKKPIGMFEYMRLVNRLETSLQKKVDLVTEQSLNPHVKPFVITDLKTLYEG